MVAKPTCERDGTDVLEVTDLTRTILLLMDEPFGPVDAQTREDLEDLTLRVRAESGITILVVTHDIDESVCVGDRVIVLTPGPGRVLADLPVNLPQLREAAGRGQPAGAQPRHIPRAAVCIVASVARAAPAPRRLLGGLPG